LAISASRVLTHRRAVDRYDRAYAIRGWIGAAGD
jgi:hypothetical protein